MKKVSLKFYDNFLGINASAAFIRFGHEKGVTICTEVEDKKVTFCLEKEDVQELINFLLKSIE